MDQTKETRRHSRSEVVRIVSEKTNKNEAEVRLITEAFTDTIIDLLEKGDSVLIHNFGLFEIRYFKERRKHNTNTKTIDLISGRYLPKFTFANKIVKNIKK